ncbi:MAG: hypothetical protein HYX66_07260 [Ignavibacteria bacterium]|nr:hypothetical protein [Ignavibacteria bacterium]
MFSRTLALFFCLLLFAAKTGYGQCDSLLQAISSDSGYAWAAFRTDGDTTFMPPEIFAPYFTFSYEADSSYSTWFFSEFMLNWKHLYLSNWCFKRVINYDTATDSPSEDWTASEMRNRSTTRTFPVIGNDTLQFFRGLSWIDRYSSALSFSRYVNNNEIGYSVELVDSGSGTRLLLLDSFAIETTTDDKKPCINSWYPMGARVRSVVPSTVEDTTSAYIRINAWAFGAAPYPFIREDGIRKMLSGYKLNSSQFTAYSDSVEANNHCGGGGAGSCDLEEIPTSSPSGILISNVVPSSISNIEVRNIDGSLIWWSSVPMASNPISVTLSPGLKIVLGMSNSNVICTTKLLIQ